MNDDETVATIEFWGCAEVSSNTLRTRLPPSLDQVVVLLRLVVELKAAD